MGTKGQNGHINNNNKNNKVRSSYQRGHGTTNNKGATTKNTISQLRVTTKW